MCGSAFVRSAPRPQPPYRSASAGGGGVLMMDLTDPSKPTRIGEAWTGEGGGGYVFGDEGFLFLGNSDFGVIFDARDPTDPVEVGRMAIEGDNDTLTPYGNIALLAVDGEANHEQSTAVVPWRTDPDTAAPLVLAAASQVIAEDETGYVLRAVEASEGVVDGRSNPPCTGIVWDPEDNAAFRCNDHLFAQTWCFGKDLAATSKPGEQRAARGSGPCGAGERPGGR